ncbi:MAG: amidase [Herpetosiphonaceae bacterium]|nr:amidase [Herpetosiphonaceae bacterium]
MNTSPLTDEILVSATAIAGLTFTPEERALMLKGVQERVDVYEQLRALPLSNEVPLALIFQPDIRPMPQPVAVADVPRVPAAPIQKLADQDDLAFASVAVLSQLIKARQVSSVELTDLYLDRLQRFDPQFTCVVTMTEELARSQAKAADAELAAGTCRGPLHGIPWGAKDLLATKGIRTTWGAAPYKEQIPATNAAVVDRLEAAGAVLLAKLTVGELAWDDIWFGGQTKNPWNLQEGSSGSSAGSGAATAAGLVGFAIGTETLGSIVSPATRCRVSGLRPTFGRVSRYGAMALSWSMDKIGPMARTVEDLGLIFQALHGSDSRDLTTVDRPFPWPPALDMSALCIGYLEEDFVSEDAKDLAYDDILKVLRGFGATLVPLKLPDYPLDALQTILYAEGAAAFDELTRSNQDDLLVRQTEDAWPTSFRKARLIPAVEYIQANRVRTLLMQSMAELMTNVDLYVGPSLVGPSLVITNFTGQPAVVIPHGVDSEGSSASITFTGRLYDEATILQVAQAYQEATDFHRQHPTGF